MQARRNPDALQRLVLDELFADALQHRHRLVCPLDAPLTLVGKLHAFYIARNLSCNCCSHDLLVQRLRLCSHNRVCHSDPPGVGGEESLRTWKSVEIPRPSEADSE